MLLSFPLMGKLHLALASVCQELEIPFLVPSSPGPKAMSLGMELAPEGSCVPFLLVLGNMREALERGADHIIMLGGLGPCRFGYFVYLAEKVLKEAGYEFTMLKIDEGSKGEALKKLQRRSPAWWVPLVRAVAVGWSIVVVNEDLDHWELEYTARLEDKIDFQQRLKCWRQELAQVNSVDGAKRIDREARAYLKKGRLIPAGKVRKIGLVGDIYTLLEPFANNNIETFLLQRNVSVYKKMSVSHWIPNVVFPWRKKPYRRGLLLAAHPFLRDPVGGFGLESVANAQICGESRLDGVIQLFPMGCMPEIVARCALNRISRVKGLPLLSITLDQHEGQVGFETRLEAFLEMLEITASSSVEKEHRNILQGEGQLT